METLRFVMVTTHYPPSHIGGDAVFVKYLSEELVKSGHEVHVFHNPSVYRMLGNVRASKTLVPIEHHPIQHAHEKGFSSFRTGMAHVTGLSGGALDELEKLTRRIGADVVHWHNTKAFIGRPVSLGGRISLFTAHDYYAVCPKGGLLKPHGEICTDPRLCQYCLISSGKLPQLWRLGRRRVFRFEEDIRVLCPSMFMAQRLRQYGVKVDHVLRNFVPVPPSVERPLVEPDPFILYVGIMERHKGPMTLLEAFNATKNNHGFRMRMIGRGSMLKCLRDRVARLGLEDRVSLPGHLGRSELLSFLGSAAALAVPSEWYENAPLVALEAMAIGTPVIGSDIGGLPEIVNLQPRPMTFEAGNLDSLSKALVSTWQNQDSLPRLRRGVKEAFLSNFSPKVHVDEYLRVIKN